MPPLSPRIVRVDAQCLNDKAGTPADRTIAAHCNNRGFRHVPLAALHQCYTKLLRCGRRFVAHCDISWQRNNRSLAGAKRTLSSGFLASLRHVFFPAKRILSDAHTPHRSSFFRPCRTVQRIPAPSTTSGTTAWKGPSSNPQRPKAFRQEFSLSIIGATENLRSSSKLRCSRDLRASYQYAAKKPPCLDGALSAGGSES
jgi:hypothetical protein